MDIKLGSVLYAQDATEEKKTRMIKVSQETTSGSLRLRICGFKVFFTQPYDLNRYIIQIKRNIPCTRKNSDDH